MSHVSISFGCCIEQFHASHVLLFNAGTCFYALVYVIDDHTNINRRRWRILQTVNLSILLNSCYRCVIDKNREAYSALDVSISLKANINLLLFSVFEYKKHSSLSFFTSSNFDIKSLLTVLKELTEFVGWRVVTITFIGVSK